MNNELPTTALSREGDETMLITPEMVAEARERIRRQWEGIPVVLMEDTPRQPISDRMRTRMQERGLQFPVPPGPLTVVMEDEIQHTPEFPVCADDAHCCCQRLEREHIIAETTPKRKRRKIMLASPAVGLDAPLNGNCGFRVLK
jgi:hypothetical protein